MEEPKVVMENAEWRVLGKGMGRKHRIGQRKERQSCLQRDGLYPHMGAHCSSWSVIQRLCGFDFILACLVGSVALWFLPNLPVQCESVNPVRWLDRVCMQ